MTREPSGTGHIALQLQNLPTLAFIGYRVKRITPCPEWLTNFGGHAAVVREICSISDCIAKPPEAWVERGGTFNVAGCYDTEESAWIAVPSGAESEYRCFAYRLLPVTFSKSGITPFGYGTTLPEPAPCVFVPLGYDVADAPVDVSHILGFGCSPLSCNGCAAEWDVNEYCLTKDLTTAVRCAQSFAETEPEPGPFYIYEVLRKLAG